MSAAVVCVSQTTIRTPTAVVCVPQTTISVPGHVTRTCPETSHKHKKLTNTYAELFDSAKPHIGNTSII